MAELYLNGVTVNSEANARRIAAVEGCFGTSGQVIYLAYNLLREFPLHMFCTDCRIVNFSATGSAGAGAGRGGGPHQGLQEETQAEAVLPLQRPPRVRQHYHQQKKVIGKTARI